MYGSSACTDSEGSAGITHHVFSRQHVAVSRPPVRAVPRSPALHSLIPQPKQCSSRHGAVMCPHGTNAIIICFVLGLPVCWRWWGRVMMNKCDSIDRAEEVTGGALLAHCPTVSTTTTIIIANITSVSQILPVWRKNDPFLQKSYEKRTEIWRYRLETTPPWTRGWAAWQCGSPPSHSSTQLLVVVCRHGWYESKYWSVLLCLLSDIWSADQQNWK